MWHLVCGNSCLLIGIPSWEPCLCRDPGWDCFSIGWDCFSIFLFFFFCFIKLFLLHFSKLKRAVTVSVKGTWKYLLDWTRLAQDEEKWLWKWATVQQKPLRCLWWQQRTALHKHLLSYKCKQMCPAWARLFVRFFSWHCRKIWAEKCWKQFQVEDNSAWDHYIWRTNEEYFLLFGRTDHDGGQELQEDQPLWFLVHRDWCVLVLLQLLGEPEQSLPHLWFEDAIPYELWWAQGWRVCVLEWKLLLY